jgi:hypothetical protein
MNALTRWLIQRHVEEVKSERHAARRAQAEANGVLKALIENGFCTDCYGRGMYDDSGYDTHIVICRTCGGTGRKP